MLYDKHKFLLVAGPCALESSEVCERVCETLKELQHQFPELNIVFSGSGLVKLCEKVSSFG